MANRNVILMMTDQQRFDTIAATGNRTIKTPNLDRLVARGVAFTHAVTPQPVCGPVRHSLLTGVGTHTVGADKLQKAGYHPHGRFVMEVLAEAGYRTGGFGKMHFRPTRAHHGFQHYAVHEEMDPDARREDDDYLMYLKANGWGHHPCPAGVRNVLYTQPQISPIPAEHHEVTWVGDRAVDFIRTFHNDPFFLFASWMQPHWPVNVPASWANLYANDQIEMPIFSDDEVLPFFVEQSRVAADIFNDGKPVPWDRVKRTKALYYASISFIDHQVGRLLDCLEGYGLLDDALVVFIADHGDLLWDHRSFNKVCAYEPSIRVPYLVSCPGLEGAGTPSGDFVNHYDVVPTVYDHTGVAPPPQNTLAGRSLLSERSQVTARDRLFFEIGDGNSPSSFIGVRTRRWKYAFYHSGPLRQLFDLENDPHELTNLCLGEMSAEHRRVADDLHRCLVAWNQAHGLPSRLDGDDLRVLPPHPVPPDRNNQDESWVYNLSDAERATIWSDARATYEAIKDERHVDPAELDLEYWEKRRGPGCIAELERLLGRKLR